MKRFLILYTGLEFSLETKSEGQNVTLVRDKILLPGFYWYDALPAQGPGFHEWLSMNRDLVKVRKSQTFADDSVFGGPNAHLWALFEVLIPVPWLDATKFGFPNTATKDTDSTVASSGAEPSIDLIDKLANWINDIKPPSLPPATPGFLLLVGLVGAGYLFRKELFNAGIAKVRSIRHSRSRGAAG